MDDENEPLTGDDTSDAGDDTSGAGDDDTSGAGDGCTETVIDSTLCGTFYHAIDVVRCVNNTLTHTLLRSFRVSEEDLSTVTTSRVLRQVTGKRLIASPDGNFDFACYLSDIEDINVIHKVNVYFTTLEYTPNEEYQH